VAEVLPQLYLHGLSSGDFVPALGRFLRSSKGLPAATVTKLTETWKAEQQAFSPAALTRLRVASRHDSPSGGSRDLVDGHRGGLVRHPQRVTYRGAWSSLG
jgi:hypothetical protein